MVRHSFSVGSVAASAFSNQIESEAVALRAQLEAALALHSALEQKVAEQMDQNEKLRGQAAATKTLEEQLKVLQTRHNAALELIGQKEEQLSDLRCDFEDMKSLYRTQILSQLEHN